MRPFFQSFGVGVGPHQSPIRFKAWELSCERNDLPPLAIVLPQKTVGTTPRPRYRIHKSRGSPFSGANPIVAHGVGVPSDQITIELSIFTGMRQRPIKSCGFEPTPFPAYCPVPTEKLFLGKGPRDIERHLIAHDVVTSPRELMGHRLDGDHSLSLGLLSVIESANQRFKANGKVGRFHKRPTEILIPVLSIALAFALAVANLLAAHTTTVRSKVSYAGKSPDISSLQHDRERQSLPDPAHA